MYGINIICVGKLKEKYLSGAVAEYAKRLSAFCKFSVTEVAEEKIADDPSPAQIQSVIQAEGKRIMQKLSANLYTVALCIEGDILSSEQFSEKLAQATVNGFSGAQLIIGGSWGLSDEVKRRANLKLSMGRMTFPHQLARVMLCEQVYRAFQIMNNGKYHK